MNHLPRQDVADADAALDDEFFQLLTALPFLTAPPTRGGSEWGLIPFADAAAEASTAATSR